MAVSIGYFKYKDPIPSSLTSGVVYKYKCSSCNATYIGKTIRHLNVRACEHMGVSHLTGKRLQPSIYKHSAIGDHLLLSGHQVSIDDFSILTRESKNFILEVKESLLILRDKPALNKTVMSSPLFLFN